MGPGSSALRGFRLCGTRSLVMIDMLVIMAPEYEGSHVPVQLPCWSQSRLLLPHVLKTKTISCISAVMSSKYLQLLFSRTTVRPFCESTVL